MTNYHVVASENYHIIHYTQQKLLTAMADMSYSQESFYAKTVSYFAIWDVNIDAEGSAVGLFKM